MSSKSLLRAVAAVAAVAVLAGTAYAEDVKVSYSLTLERPETGAGNVTMKVSGLTSTGLRLVRSGTPGSTWFDGVTAAGSSGAPCGVVPTDDGWYVTTGGSRDVTVSYVIRPGQMSAYGHVGLISADFAALDGALVFLQPGNEQTIVSADLRATLPAGWRAVTGWTESQGLLTPDASFAPLRAQLGQSLLCFGPFTTVSRTVGANTLAVSAPASYPQADADALVSVVERVYTRIHDAFGFDTGGVYRVVCLPPAPDGASIAAGAWCDGQATTLVGRFDLAETLRLMRNLGRFTVMGYLAQAPYGVDLQGEDQWLYYAAVSYGEQLAYLASGQSTQNVYYAPIYTAYAGVAGADFSPVDAPIADMATAKPETAQFLQTAKAPILLMRLDFQMRSDTENALNIEDFFKALYRKGSGYLPGVKVLDTLAGLTNIDYTPFYDRFVRERTLILPAWPEFIDTISAQAADAGPVAFRVDGTPVYTRELQIMCDALASEGRFSRQEDIVEAARAALVSEKLMDKALFDHRLNVVPEAYWNMRMALPGQVMKLLITRKRQALKDILFDDWFTRSRMSARIEAGTPPQQETTQGAVELKGAQ